MTAFLPLLQRFWFVPLIGALLIALLLTRAANDRNRARLELCNTKQEVNLQSIASLKEQLADQNRAVQEIAAAGEARRKAAQDAMRTAVEREKVSQATIDRLRASGAVRRSDDAPCVISQTLAGAKGL